MSNRAFPLLLTRPALSCVALLIALLAAATTVGAAGGAMPQPEQDTPMWSRGQHFQLRGEIAPVAQDGIHDPAGEAVQILQQPYEAMAGFPRDDAGMIDWVKTLRNRLIEPRTSVEGTSADGGDMFPVDFDVILKNTQSMPWVRFPHLQHTEWLTCANCHPAIFIPQAGANPISMSAIIQGDFCGVCHGKVAFAPTLNCGRCHSVPQDVTLLR